MKTRLTHELQPHPKVKHLIGRWRPDSPEMLAMRQSIQNCGILHPLLVTKTGYILDGVTRWQAAKALQLEEVPVIEHDEEDALPILIATTINRRHQTKSQLAFSLAPFFLELAEESKARLLEHFSRPTGIQCQLGKTGQISQFSAPSTVEEAAAQAGLSRRLVGQALELLALFDAYPDPWPWSDEDLEAIGEKPGTKLTFAQYFTARIMDPDNPISLGGALAGLKAKVYMAEHEKKFGVPHGGGKPPRGVKDGPRPRQLVLFERAWRDLKRRWRYWDELDEVEQAAAGLVVMDALEAAPRPLLIALKKGIEKLLRQSASTV